MSKPIVIDPREVSALASRPDTFGRMLPDVRFKLAVELLNIWARGEFGYESRMRRPPPKRK